MNQRSAIARSLCGVAACALLGAAFRVGTLQAETEPAAPSEVRRAVPVSDIRTAEFLDEVGQQTKVLWRKLYRNSPPTPSAERPRAAFILGGLVSDGYLALKAGDAQQFKNNNQDIIKYCRVLGLAEKLTPGILAQSKMAEGEDWVGARRQVEETEAMIEKLLGEQRDEDLAILVNLGTWLRLYEISATIVHNDPMLQNKLLCIGSLALVRELALRYQLLSETVRRQDAVQMIGTALDMLDKHWSSTEKPDQEIVDFTWEKVSFLMNKLTLK